MANRLSRLLAVPLILLAAGCNKELPAPQFDYPESKVWVHGANDTLVAQQKSEIFDGLELDVNYSEYQKKLFIGHELYDTIHGVTLEQWFAALPHPQNNYYWVDMKNLTAQTAPDIAHQIKALTEQYGITGQLLVENTDEKALKTVKDSGLHVILWVENTYLTGRCDKNWRKSTTKQIEYLYPDALSCEYRMHPMLTVSFPNQNIHYWDTPRDYNDTNVAHTQMLLREPAVKVVLVDYPVDISKD